MKRDAASKLLLKLKREKIQNEIQELLRNDKTSKVTICIKGDQMNIDADADTDCKNAIICGLAFASIVETIYKKYKADNEGAPDEELDLFREVTETAYIETLIAFITVDKKGSSFKFSEETVEVGDDDEAD